MFGVRRRVEGAGRDLDIIAKAIESGAGVGGEASSVIAALALAGFGGDLGPPLVQDSPKRPGLLRGASELTLAKLLPKAPRTSLLTVSAGLLQILDDWHASHEAAQLAEDLGETEFSAYWHGIAHRREPDPGNAAYWFRRVGKHPTFGPLAEAVKPLLDADLAATLTPGGEWSPIAFVHFCGEASKTLGSPEEALSRRIQRIEMLILLDATCIPL